MKLLKPFVLRSLCKPISIHNIKAPRKRLLSFKLFTRRFHERLDDGIDPRKLRDS